MAPKLFVEQQGQGPPIVFLHGMAGSRRYWYGVLKQLPKTFRTVNIDLLGFGLSPMPKASAYDYDDHIAAILNTLDKSLLKKPLTLVAHSMGALLALRIAAQKQLKIKKLVLVGLPIYTDPAAFKSDITKDTLVRRLVYYGPTSHLFCSTWCKHLRPLTKHLAPYYLRHLPKAVARDSLLHSWRSYSLSRFNLIERQSALQDLTKVNVPTIFVYGDREPDYTRHLSDELLRHKNMSVVKLEGTHHLPLERPKELAKLIAG